MPAAPIHADASPLQNAALFAPIDLVQAEKTAADQLLTDTNVLLSKMGFGDRTFAHVADLVASVSSMSVALYEKLFQFRLRDVERVPHTRQDYEHNAQLVANALRSALLEQGNDGDLVDELTGERLCAGDLGSIRRLLTMLEQVYTLLFEASEAVGERLRDVSLASLGTTAIAHDFVSSTRRVPLKLASKQRKGSLTKNCDLNTTQIRETQKSKDMKVRRKASQSRGSQKQEEVRTGCTVDARRRTLMGGNNRSERADAIVENNKKRSRLLEQSLKESSNRSSIVANDTTGNQSTRRGHSRNSLRSRRRHRDNDQELLATKKYGRFVAGTGDENPFLIKASVDDSKRRFFEGVSTVLHNSDESLHFIEDEGVLAQDFSSISIEDADQEQKGNEDPVKSISDGENATPNEKLEAMTHQKSVNQQIAQKEDDSSPVKKKVARGEPSAPVRPSASLTTRHDKYKSLYPLLPKTKQSAAKSKVQTQYLRYKLTLKNHLQELRQREASQRQQLERAFKSGEHLANVDKIRSRRFEQDVRLHRIAIGLEAKNEEEKQLRQTMNHLLGLEKEKLREEHRLTTSVLKQIQKEHTEREQAMENFYASQIQLVKERTRREVKERELVEKAQRSASETMMRELRHEKKNQLAALLQEKQHLEATRRFRHASQLAQFLEKTEERSVRKTDAFYTAAMKARERNERTKQPHKQRRTSLDPYRSGVKKLTTHFSKSLF